MRLLLFILCLVTLSAFRLGAQNLEGIGKQKPLRLSSGFSLNAGGYQSNGIDNRQNPYTWSMAGSPTVEVYGIRFPFNFVLSNQHRSFQQPFNQFGATPTWKWIKVHAGYSAARFSNYTLAGRRFLGAGVELSPGLFRFGYIQGRFQKAVAYDSTATRIPGQIISNIPVPAFSRYGRAMRIGVGNKRSFFDISYLKAQDRENSIFPIEGTTPLPQENAVLGAALQITMFKKLTFKADGAVSAYTRDVTADTIDLTKIPVENLIRKIMLPHLTTQILTAGETSIGYRDRLFGLKVSYRRVDPDFKSMGAYFFQTDLEQYTIAPNVNLFKNKMQVGGSFGVQRNNLLNIKASDSRRVIGSAFTNYNDGKRFFVQANYSNYGVSQRPRTSLAPVLIADTLRLTQVSRAISITPGCFFRTKGVMHNIVFTTQFNDLNDQNPTSVYDADMRTITGNLNYSTTFEKSGFSVNGGLMYQRIENATGLITNTGFTGGAQKNIAKDKGNAGISASLYANNAADQPNGSTLQLSGNLQWKLQKWSSLFIQLTWMKVAGVESRNFSEVYGNTGLTFHF